MNDHLYSEELIMRSLLGLFIYLLTFNLWSQSIAPTHTPYTPPEGIPAQDIYEQACLKNYTEESDAFFEIALQLRDQISELSTYLYFDKIIDQGVPQKALKEAFAFFVENKEIIKNKDYITIGDFTQHYGKKRFFLINMSTGNVEKMHVAHGENSDLDKDGLLDKFSNTDSSYMSSEGFMLTAENIYDSKIWGESLRLYGLEPQNSNALSRGIVIHGWNMVDEELAESFGKIGFSQGCPALGKDTAPGVIEKIKGKSLYYSYGG